MRLWRTPNTTHGFGDDRFKTGVMRRTSGPDGYSKPWERATMPPMGGQMGGPNGGQMGGMNGGQMGGPPGLSLLSEAPAIPQPRPYMAPTLQGG